MGSVGNISNVQGAWDPSDDGAPVITPSGGADALTRDRITRLTSPEASDVTRFIPLPASPRAGAVTDFARARTLAETPGPRQAEYAQRMLQLARGVRDPEERREQIFEAHQEGVRWTSGPEQSAHAWSLIRLAEAPADNVERRSHRLFEAYHEAAGAESLPMAERIDDSRKALAQIRNPDNEFEGYLNHSKLDVDPDEQLASAKHAMNAASNRYQRTEGYLRLAQLTHGTEQTDAMLGALKNAEEPTAGESGVARTWHAYQQVKTYAQAARMQATGIAIPGRPEDFAALARRGAQEIGSPALLRETDSFA